MHWSHPHNHGSVHKTYTWSHSHKHGSGIPIAAWRTDNPVCVYSQKERCQSTWPNTWENKISTINFSQIDCKKGFINNSSSSSTLFKSIYVVAGSVLWFLILAILCWLFGDNQNRKLKIRMRKHHACLLIIVDYWERIDRFCIDHLQIQPLLFSLWLYST